ncbi:hypothetical protein, partial [Enterobacter sichuanensis]
MSRPPSCTVLVSRGLGQLCISDSRCPEQPFTRPPGWLTTQLRDGNQALGERMDSARKLQFW